jgi:hypothetical protein
MIYIFRVVDTGFVKLGFTQGNPWTRVATGFWSNIHPKACCHKLGWDNLELLALFDGSKAVEAEIRAAVPPTRGEFWPEHLLQLLLNLSGLLCPSLPLPERPAQPPEVDRAAERLACCGGPIFCCSTCSLTFKRAHHLRQHLESCMSVKVACTACSKQMLKRNLNRHMGICKRLKKTKSASTPDFRCEGLSQLPAELWRHAVELSKRAFVSLVHLPDFASARAPLGSHGVMAVHHRMARSLLCTHRSRLPHDRVSPNPCRFSVGVTISAIRNVFPRDPGHHYSVLKQATGRVLESPDFRLKVFDAVQHPLHHTVAPL